MINLDHAATTPLRPEALNAMLPYFTEHAANANALYAEGRRARAAIDAARRQIAEAIHAKPAEIYFTGSGSEADNWALFGAMRAMAGKNHIVTTQVEHHAILNACAALEKLGYEVSYVPVDRQGCVDPEAIENAVRPETGMVSVMLANNEVGTIQPISEIAKVAHMHGALMHTDAVQAVGHIPVDVEALDVDLLSLSAHKFHGPKGTGVLYARQGVFLTNLIEGGAQERGKRGGTENVPGIAAMAAALTEACANMDENTKKVTALRDKLIDGISKIPHCALNGAREPRLPGNVNFCFEGIEGESLLLLLDRKGIAASSGSACTSGSLNPSHVLLALGLPHEVAHGSLRLSVGEYNTDEEMAYIVENVRQVVDYLRSISPVWDELETGARPHLI